MRSVKGSLLLCALLVILMPAPAHAFFGWLDNLSGPGPFMGEEIEIRLFCFGGKDGGVKFVPIVVESGCLVGTRKHHKVSINLIAGTALAIAKENIQYADPKANRFIGLVDYGVLVSRSVLDQRVELKGGVEGNYFYGPAFDNFTRLSVVAFFDWKPFARKRSPTPSTDQTPPQPAAEQDANKSAWRDIVTLRLGALFFPGEFDSTDFGATPGGFHSSHDLIKVVGVVFDFGARR
jgi:hypothetical protein